MNGKCEQVEKKRETRKDTCWLQGDPLYANLEVERSIGHREDGAMQRKGEGREIHAL